VGSWSWIFCLNRAASEGHGRPGADGLKQFAGKGRGFHTLSAKMTKTSLREVLETPEETKVA
jgi:hypothetical protein